MARLLHHTVIWPDTNVYWSLSRAASGAVTGATEAGAKAPSQHDVARRLLEPEPRSCLGTTGAVTRATEAGAKAPS